MRGAVRLNLLERVRLQREFMSSAAIAMIALLQPTANGGLVARIVVVEVALEKAFFSWDHNRRDEADSWNERYE